MANLCENGCPSACFMMNSGKLELTCTRYRKPCSKVSNCDDKNNNNTTLSVEEKLRRFRGI